MIQNYNTYRVLQLFFDYPSKHFQLREICRILKLGLPSVRNHIKKLEKFGFIRKEKKRVYASFISNRNELFKIYKRNDVLLRLYETGLIESLSNTFVPDVIVLFGSASRGEDIETSDIDLFLIAKEKKIKLDIFEKKLKRKISLHFENDILDTPKELKNNIINGIVVYGYLKVF
jgi:predicted nucleotidyltransferase